MSRFPGWLRRRPRPEESRDAQVRAAAVLGFPLAPAAHPSGYGCSCDRIGCPTPGLHPISFAWQTQATTDQEQVDRWLAKWPDANFVTATGRRHDVLDVPRPVGEWALRRMAELGLEPGPVAALGAERLLFFTRTRGTPDDEDEWWPCELDSHPETTEDHPGVRWHCRGSYVLMPPSRLPSGGEVRWVTAADSPLPDPLPVLAVLTDACEAVGIDPADDDHHQGGWLIGR